MKDDLQLMFSIKVSVRSLSSYQKEVGISKSVSWGGMLRSFPPGWKQEYEQRKHEEEEEEYTSWHKVLT